MSTAAELKTRWEKLDAELAALGNDYDDKRAALKAEYGPKIIAANKAAVEAQKAYCDAEAAEALVDRPDGEAVAKALGLTLPT